MKVVLCGLLLSMVITPVLADWYEVAYVNGYGKIFIGGKPVRKRLRFKDCETIHWTSAKQSFRAVNLTELRKNRNVQKVFAARKAPKQRLTFLEYLRSTQQLGTKGFNEEREDTLLLLDSLIVIGNHQFLPETQFCAVWKDGDTEVVASLTASDDKTEIYLTPAIFCGRPPRPVEVRIMATDHWDNETPHLVRTIWIEPLPL